MKPARLSAPIERPESIWQWLCLLTLIMLGWVSLAQLETIFARSNEDDGSLVVYDADGVAHVFLSDEAAGRPDPYSALSFDFAQDERSLLKLDVALMKPSCCDAPEGLSHLWYLPKCLGTLPTIFPGHPGQGARAADPGSPRGSIP